MEIIFKNNPSAAFDNSSGEVRLTLLGKVMVRRPDFTSRKTLFLIVAPTLSIGSLL